MEPLIGYMPDTNNHLDIACHQETRTITLRLTKPDIEIFAHHCYQL